MPVNTVRRDRPTLGGNKKNLLDDAPAAATPSTLTSEMTADSLIIRADDYRYPVEEQVPSGYFFSEVARVSVRRKGEKDMVDVCYDIEGYDNGNRGQRYRIKQTYPVGSEYLQAFFNAMAAAGVVDVSIKEAVGVRERILLAYVSKTSEIGSIIKRCPDKVSASAQDDDSDYAECCEDEE